MKLKKINKTKGFTLIELMVGVALFSVITMGLLSVMIFSLKMNYINKDTYDADSYSKTFFESLKIENYRPKPPEPPTGGGSPSLNKTLQVTFSDVSQVTEFLKDTYSKVNKDSVVGISKNPSTELSEAIEDVTNTAKIDNPNHTVGMLLNVIWDNTEGVYQIETWTWILSKGEASLINRKTLQSPSVEAIP